MEGLGRFVIGFIALFVSSCTSSNDRYASFLEAQTACAEWMNGKKIVYFERDQTYQEMEADFEALDPKPKDIGWNSSPDNPVEAWAARSLKYHANKNNKKRVSDQMDSRNCKFEERTKQFLGLEHDWDNEWVDGSGRFRVVKNFQF